MKDSSLSPKKKCRRDCHLNQWIKEFKGISSNSYEGLRGVVDVGVTFVPQTHSEKLTAMRASF